MFIDRCDDHDLDIKESTLVVGEIVKFRHNFNIPLIYLTKYDKNGKVVGSEEINPPRPRRVKIGDESNDSDDKGHENFISGYFTGMKYNFDKWSIVIKGYSEYENLKKNKK